MPNVSQISLKHFRSAAKSTSSSTSKASTAQKRPAGPRSLPKSQAACQRQLQAQRPHHSGHNYAILGQPVCEFCDEEGNVEDLPVHDDELDLFTN
jgi:hypothetical protein